MHSAREKSKEEIPEKYKNPFNLIPAELTCLDCAFSDQENQFERIKLVVKWLPEFIEGQNIGFASISRCLADPQLCLLRWKITQPKLKEMLLNAGFVKTLAECLNQPYESVEYIEKGIFYNILTIVHSLINFTVDDESPPVLITDVDSLIDKGIAIDFIKYGGIKPVIFYAMGGGRFVEVIRAVMLLRFLMSLEEVYVEASKVKGLAEKLLFFTVKGTDYVAKELQAGVQDYEKVCYGEGISSYLQGERNEQISSYFEPYYNMSTEECIRRAKGRCLGVTENALTVLSFLAKTKEGKNQLLESGAFDYVVEMLLHYTFPTEIVADSAISMWYLLSHWCTNPYKNEVLFRRDGCFLECVYKWLLAPYHFMAFGSVLRSLENFLCLRLDKNFKALVERPELMRRLMCYINVNFHPELSILMFHILLACAKSGNKELCKLAVDSIVPTVSLCDFITQFSIDSRMKKMGKFLKKALEDSYPNFKKLMQDHSRKKNDPEEALKLKEEGNVLFRAGDYNGAKKKYLEAMSYLSMSTLFFEEDMNKASTSSKDLSKPISTLLGNLATCFLKLERFDDMLLCLLTALSYDVENEKNLGRLATVLKKTDHNIESLRTLYYLKCMRPHGGELVINTDEEIKALEVKISSLDLCGYCFKWKNSLKLCGACFKKKYCSRECQESDWSNHKQICLHGNQMSQK